MYKRAAPPSRGPVYLVGGSSFNIAMSTFLKKELSADIIVPENPQITVALGAAVIAGETVSRHRS